MQKDKTHSTRKVLREHRPQPLSNALSHNVNKSEKVNYPPIFIMANKPNWKHNFNGRGNKAAWIQRHGSTGNIIIFKRNKDIGVFSVSHTGLEKCDCEKHSQDMCHYKTR